MEYANSDLQRVSNLQGSQDGFQEVSKMPFAPIFPTPDFGYDPTSHLASTKNKRRKAKQTIAPGLLYGPGQKPPPLQIPRPIPVTPAEPTPAPLPVTPAGMPTSHIVPQGDSLGMPTGHIGVWPPPPMGVWDRHFAALRSFALENGHCRVPASFKYECVLPGNDVYNDDIGVWLAKQRRARTRNDPRYRLSPEREAKLQELVDAGLLCWSAAPIEESWSRHYAALLRFGEEQGHCNVPQNVVFECVLPGLADDGGNYYYKANLGQWLSKQRQARRGTYKPNGLPPDREARLQGLVDKGLLVWEGALIDRSGLTQPSKSTILISPHDGSATVNVASGADATGSGSQEGDADVDLSEGIVKGAEDWPLGEDTWSKHFAALLRFGEEHGHCNVPQNIVFQCILPGLGPEGTDLDYKCNLGQWLAKQRQARRGKFKPIGLSEEKEALLQDIVNKGMMAWDGINRSAKSTRTPKSIAVTLTSRFIDENPNPVEHALLPAAADESAVMDAPQSSTESGTSTAPAAAMSSSYSSSIESNSASAWFSSASAENVITSNNIITPEGSTQAQLEAIVNAAFEVNQSTPITPIAAKRAVRKRGRATANATSSSDTVATSTTKQTEELSVVETDLSTVPTESTTLPVSVGNRKRGRPTKAVVESIAEHDSELSVEVDKTSINAFAAVNSAEIVRKSQGHE